MLVDIQSVFRQPEIPTDIRRYARSITELLTPFEGLIEPGESVTEHSQLVFSILRQEDAVDAILLTALDSYAVLLGRHFHAIIQSRQGVSAVRREFRRTQMLLARWVGELRIGNRLLAEMLLRDAHNYAAHTLLEATTPHPILRPYAKAESVRLSNSENQPDAQHDRVVQWIQYRDGVVSGTSKASIAALKEIIEQTAPFVSDIGDILDLNLKPHERFASGYITLVPPPAQAAIFQVKHLQIQCNEDIRKRAVVMMALVRPHGPPIGLQLSRLTGELVPNSQCFMSAKPMFTDYGYGEIYDALRGICAYFLYDCLTKGHLEVQPWIDPTLVEELEDDQPSEEVLEPEPTSASTADPLPEELSPTIVPTERKQKVTQFVRGKVTWRNIMWTFRSYGITVEWNGHPMLCKDGKRVRYPNPHDSDARTNTRFLTHALRAFGIPRQEFYDRLFA